MEENRESEEKSQNNETGGIDKSRQQTEKILIFTFHISSPGAPHLQITGLVNIFDQADGESQGCRLPMGIEIDPKAR